MKQIMVLLTNDYAMVMTLTIILLLMSVIGICVYIKEVNDEGGPLGVSIRYVVLRIFSITFALVAIVELLYFFKLEKPQIQLFIKLYAICTIVFFMIFIFILVFPFLENIVFDIEEKINNIPMQEKLFLLSVEEVLKYMPTDESRRCSFNNKMCGWWLRSLGTIEVDKYAAYVSCSGYLNTGGNEISFKDAVIRPALYVNPEFLKTLEHGTYEYKYRGNTEWITLDEERTTMVSHEHKIYETVKFGSLEWIVLNKETGLLLSQNGVCQYQFDDKSNIYKKSKIKKYLNKVLLKRLFNDKERKEILTTKINGIEELLWESIQNNDNEKLEDFLEESINKKIEDDSDDGNGDADFNVAAVIASSIIL